MHFQRKEKVINDKIKPVQSLTPFETQVRSNDFLNNKNTEITSLSVRSLSSRCTTGVRFPKTTRNFLSAAASIQVNQLSRQYLVTLRGLAADYTPQSIVEIKNVWSFTSTTL
jgi:hypothetical protein